MSNMMSNEWHVHSGSIKSIEACRGGVDVLSIMCFLCQYHCGKVACHKIPWLLHYHNQAVVTVTCLHVSSYFEYSLIHSLIHSGVCPCAHSFICLFVLDLCLCLIFVCS